MRYGFRLLCLFALLQSYNSQAQKLTTPQKTIKTLIKAIDKQDLELYKKCWDPDRLMREGGYQRLADKPEQWAKLQKWFNGRPKIETKYSMDKAACRAELVFSPINRDNVRLVKKGNQWLMHTW